MNKAANVILWLLVGFGSMIVSLFLAVVAMLTETLTPHIVEFCLMAWERLTVQVSYRAMLIGFIVLALAIFLFTFHLVYQIGRTRTAVKQLLQKNIPLSARASASRQR